MDFIEFYFNLEILLFFYCLITNEMDRIGLKDVKLKFQRNLFERKS